MDESEAIDHQTASMTVSNGDLAYMYTNYNQKASNDQQEAVSEIDLTYMYANYS